MLNNQVRKCLVNTYAKFGDAEEVAQVDLKNSTRSIQNRKLSREKKTPNKSDLKL